MRLVDWVLRLVDWLLRLVDRVLSPVNWLRSMLGPPNPRKDPAFQRENAWVAGYRADDSGVPGALVWDHAKARYADSVATSNDMNALADQLLRTGGVLATILIAAVAAFKLQAGWSVRVAFCWFVLSMFVVLWSRRPLDCPVHARIRDVLAGIAQASNPEAWLSASLHKTVEGMRVVNNWRAARLAVAGILICAGVACLLPIAFGL